MKKHLIAAAVAAAVAVPAMAQVTVYGVLDVGYSSLDTDTAGVNTGSDAFSWSNDVGSRLGFRGTEDLGGGIKASFALETGLSAGNATAAAATSLGSRAQWLDLSTASGSIRVGFHDSVHRTVVNSFDASSATNAIGNVLQKDGVLSQRFNGVTITTPTFSGLQGSVSYSKNTQTAGAANPVDASGFGALARFTSGKLSLAAAYSRLNNDAAAVAAVTHTMTAGTSNVNVVALDASRAETDITALGASYDLGMARVMATHGKVVATDSLSPTKVSTATSKRDFTQLGLQVPMGATTIFAQFTTGNSQTGTGAAVGHDRDVDGHTLGARYAYSKRTSAYFIYGADEIQTAATTKTKRDQVNLGLIHSF